jgi:hypothetical protein
VSFSEQAEQMLLRTDAEGYLDAKRKVFGVRNCPACWCKSLLKKFTAIDIKKNCGNVAVVCDI